MHSFHIPVYKFATFNPFMLETLQLTISRRHENPYVINQTKKSGTADFQYLASEALKEIRINGLPQNTIWKAFPNTILRSSVTKIKRNMKMTVF